MSGELENPMYIRERDERERREMREMREIREIRELREARDLREMIQKREPVSFDRVPHYGQEEPESSVPCQRERK